MSLSGKISVLYTNQNRSGTFISSITSSKLSGRVRWSDREDQAAKLPRRLRSDRQAFSLLATRRQAAVTRSQAAAKTSRWAIARQTHTKQAAVITITSRRRNDCEPRCSCFRRRCGDGKPSLFVVFNGIMINYLLSSPTESLIIVLYYLGPAIYHVEKDQLPRLAATSRS